MTQWQTESARDVRGDGEGLVMAYHPVNGKALVEVEGNVWRKDSNVSGLTCAGSAIDTDCTIIGHMFIDTVEHCDFAIAVRCHPPR